jgi:hypothetical protein
MILKIERIRDSRKVRLRLSGDGTATFEDDLEHRSARQTRGPG